LVKIDFDKNNQYDLELEAQWESAVTVAKLLMTIFNKKMSTKLIIKKSPIKIELFGLIK
jgi:hypothetical protein